MLVQTLVLQLHIAVHFPEGTSSYLALVDNRVMRPRPPRNRELLQEEYGNHSTR